MYHLLWAICRSTKISNSRPLIFYPLSHFPSYFIVNEGKIKAKLNILPRKRGFFLGSQEGSEEDESKYYVLQADNDNDNVLVKVKNTTLNYL